MTIAAFSLKTLPERTLWTLCFELKDNFWTNFSSKVCLHMQLIHVVNAEFRKRSWNKHGIKTKSNLISFGIKDSLIYVLSSWHWGKCHKCKKWTFFLSPWSSNYSEIFLPTILLYRQNRKYKQKSLHDLHRVVRTKWLNCRVRVMVHALYFGRCLYF